MLGRAIRFAFTIAQLDRSAKRNTRARASRSIIAKMNALVDQQIIQALYAASHAGERSI